MRSSCSSGLPGLIYHTQNRAARSDAFGEIKSTRLMFKAPPIEPASNAVALTRLAVKANSRRVAIERLQTCSHLGGQRRSGIDLQEILELLPDTVVDFRRARGVRGRS